MLFVVGLPLCAALLLVRCHSAVSLDAPAKRSSSVRTESSLGRGIGRSGSGLAPGSATFLLDSVDDSNGGGGNSGCPRFSGCVLFLLQVCEVSSRGWSILFFSFGVLKSLKVGKCCP